MGLTSESMDNAIREATALRAVDNGHSLYDEDHCRWCGMPVEGAAYTSPCSGDVVLARERAARREVGYWRDHQARIH